MNRTKRRWLTVDEFDVFVGNPCERCAKWDLEEEVCKVGRRPRIYYLEDGPNERCHGVKYCMKFEQYRDETDDGSMRMVGAALDCNSQRSV